ncbi:reverse transcriptase [Gossypium australe]|uniref:Reverse transcriptase n=1 Tax=Gossypium australe TaxID=47621 RepID=A0A5B6WZ51_9ROSI|nr:reverse transcriptase [Gossypium australe]
MELDKRGDATEESKINETATLYFQKLFMSNRVGDLSHLLQGIEESISLDINTALLSNYMEEEVFSALKGIGPTKAPGPDGFLALFFQRYWHIVACVCYKIVAKTIANRFQEVIGRCIEAAQSAFVPGRLISDNVLLAYEILHTFRQKRIGKK